MFDYILILSFFLFISLALNVWLAIKAHLKSMIQSEFGALRNDVASALTFFKTQVNGHLTTLDAKTDDVCSAAKAKFELVGNSLETKLGDGAGKTPAHTTTADPANPPQ